MAFQPFGYHFEVRSTFSPDAVKAAIRARKKRWFDAKGGARGWIAGPVICLQSSKSSGAPMLIGLISRDDLGTRISGRAGYLGSIGILVIVPFAAFFLYMIIATSDYSLKSIALLGILVGLVSLVFWADQRDAEPLVRFLRDAANKTQQPSHKLPVAAQFSNGVTLNINGTSFDDSATPDSVRDALLEIEGDGFVILSSAEEAYIQTVSELGGYIMERREGDDQHHYRAVRRGVAQGDDIFTLEEALAVFQAYGAASPMPSFLDRKKIRV